MSERKESVPSATPEQQQAHRRNARRKTRAAPAAEAQRSGLPLAPSLKETQALDPLRLTPAKRSLESSTPTSKRRKRSRTSDIPDLQPAASAVPEADDTMADAEEQRARESLQQLLSQLGSFSNAFNANRNKFTNILLGLKKMGDEPAQMGALVELCDLLAMATEDSMGGFKSEEFVAALVDLLHFEHNPEAMLLATRALAYMVEALPSSGAAIASSGAVPVFCARMLSIQYIDVAEQSLQALFRLSAEHPDALLENGALLAVLAFLDFFSTASQRTCVATAANICRGSVSAFDMVRSALPNLTGILLNHDKQVVHSALLCFARLTARCGGNSEQLSDIGSEDAVKNLLALINGTTPLGTSVPKSTAFTILARVAACSPSVAVTLLDGGILPILATVLDPRTADVAAAGVDSPIRSSLGSSPMLAYDSAASDDLMAALSLAESLLPALPATQAMPTEHKGRFSVPKKASSRSVKAEKPSALAVTFTERPELVQQIGEQLYCSVQTVFTATVSKKVKAVCLGILVRVLHFSSPEQLKSLLRDLGTSSFIALLLGRPHLAHIAAALYMAQLLMRKLPEIFVVYFYREGVFQGIEKLCASPVSVTSPKGSSNVSSMKKWIYTQALDFTKRYASKKDDAAAGTSLDSMAKAVQALGAAGGVLEERQHLETMRGILAEGMSNYEFLTSGLVPALAQYFKPGDDFQRRAEVFVDVMDEDGQLPWHELFSHLQNSLAQLEAYPLYDNNTHGANSGLKYLTQPMKLKICPLEGVSEEYVDIAAKGGIMIEAMASVAAIEEFIISSKKESGDEERRGGLFESLRSLRALSKRAKRQQRRQQRGVGVHDLAGSANDASANVGSEPSGSAPTDSASDEDNAEDSEEADEMGEEEEEEEEAVRRARGHSFALFLKGERLAYKRSILQEAYRLRDQEVEQTSNVFSPAKALWADVHTITFRHLTEEEKEASKKEGEAREEDPPATSASEPAGTCETTTQILGLLKTLEGMVAGKGMEELLANSKLAAKLQRQLQDGLTLCASALPPWCMRLATEFPFLFPYEYRVELFKASYLGVARALHALQEHSESALGDDGSQFRVGRIQRQKVRVSREGILECAQKALELYGRSKTMLEVEFYGEEGTGTGPSLEFFTLVSQQLQRTDLAIWYEEDTAELHSSGQTLTVAYSGHGLFPKPLPPGKQLEAALPWFLMLGRFLGKAVLDSRLVDITFAPPLLRWMLGKPLVEADLAVISPTVAKSIDGLRQYVVQRAAILSDGFLNEKERVERANNLRFCDGTIEDLGLDFTFPGQPEWELKPNGKEVEVTAGQLEEYLDLVVGTFLGSGVERQLAELKKGFEEVIPLRSLRLFHEDELQNLLSGFDEAAEEVWGRAAFLAAISCDHHYSSSSAPVGYLADVVSSLDHDQRRAFVQFVTGTPRLPVGGFRSLTPPLTVVRKETGDQDPDQFLPSVMTCAKVLKLPAYTSVDAARLRLLFAISEGQDSFALS